MTGTWVLLGAVAAAALTAALLRARDGRLRRPTATPAVAPGATGGGSGECSEVDRPAGPTGTGTAGTGQDGPAGADAGRNGDLPAPVTDALADDGITLVQISTTFCAPCRHTRATLRALADSVPGLEHVDLDVTDRPEIAETLGVLRTPTTIAYTADGGELLRVSGVPKLDRLRSALRPLVEVHTRVPRTENGSRSGTD